MDETQHYDAILETYKKQEAPLEEKHEQLNKYLTEYQDAIKCVENIKKYVEDESLKLNQEKLKLLENMQKVLSTCEETDLTWKEEKQKQNKLCESKIKMNSAAETRKDKLQEVSKDLRQLEIEHQIKNIATKIEDYRNKTRNVSESVAEQRDEYQHLNSAVRTSDYNISPEVKEQYKSKCFVKSLKQINEEIKKVQKNIHNIDAKAKELEEQL